MKIKPSFLAPIKYSFMMLGVVFTTTLPVYAAGISGELEETVVTGRSAADSLMGVAEAASVGTVLSVQIEHRPILRPAEILETIPGMVVTQHSGGGKANQYYLRGFNLDHSTDFANYVEGAPVNMVTHGHGQGYSDNNFLIPELLDRMVYKKGPYYASEGDFSSVGSSRIYYARYKASNKIKLTLGEDGYRRALLVGGYNQGANVSDKGSWVYALESLQDDGPWANPDDMERSNAFLKYSKGDESTGFSISGLYFDSQWQGTDQIPRRLVKNGTLDRFDTLDDSTGGDTHRYQLAYQQWAELSPASRIKANAYLIDYQLNLFSNFTYFSQDDIDDPDFRGDQIGQFDDRLTYGGNIEWQHDLDARHQVDIGMDLRYDDISDVGVGNSQHAALYAMNSRAAVEQLGLGLYTSMHSQWNDWFASIVGVRYDYYDIDVRDKLDTSASGGVNDDFVSPKLSLRFGPFDNTEFFINYGKGFHSNDARGVVADAGVPLLAESEGYELGMRSSMFDNLQLSLVLFQLELDSELVFVGDEGTTEPKDATERTGLEFSVYYHPVDWFILDMDYTTAKARYKNNQYDGGMLLGDKVPDSVEDVFSLGASIELDNGLYGGLRLRYFGPRNLTEAGDIQSDSTAIVNANIGYQLKNGLSFSMEIINLTDRDDADITYFYASRTLAERQNNIDPIEDYHSHPMVPRTIRVSMAYEF